LGRAVGKTGIGLVVHNRHADGAVGMLIAIVVVMEGLSSKGEKKEQEYEDRQAPEHDCK
jgi:hypothetical protein